VSWIKHREQLVRDIASLRAAEAATASSDQLAGVRQHLEELVGRTVPRASAARTLGVSQTALDRWIRSGDVPAVMTPRGRDEVPLSALVELVQAVDRRRDELNPLASVLRSRRAQAEQSDASRLITRVDLADSPSGHRGAELRSLAYHRAVADRLDE
jgi:hypothetical protein